MTKILLVYPPFCTPASPPYSIANLYGFLKKNIDKKYSLDCVDLNVFFHKKMFSKYHAFYSKLDKNVDISEYDKITKEFQNETKAVYSASNKSVVHGGTPEMFLETLNEIKKKSPDIVAFSIVYSSQAFYAYSLILELKKSGIKCVVGGPAVNEKLINAADAHLKNEIELFNYITGKGHEDADCDTYPYYSCFNLSDYFVSEPVIPIRTSSTCYYQKCSFCTHHGKSMYFEFPLEKIKKTIMNSKQKHFFIIDDMIHKKRLLELAVMFTPLNIDWTCQLRPTADLDFETLKTLRESGLKIITWGFESGSDKVLKLMNKGTNKNDISKVLKDSHNAGIRNSVYVMIGFPGETKEDFFETIDFLKENSEYIDLIWTSVFGLQKDSPVYNNPDNFGITEIIEKKRTILEPKISYNIKEGFLTNEEATKLRDGYRKTFDKINKFPKEMNFFREHMFVFDR